jgi:hypothetical protein
LRHVLTWLQSQDVLFAYAVSNHQGANANDDEIAAHPATLPCGSVDFQFRPGGGAQPALYAPIGGSDSTGVGDIPIDLENLNSYSAPAVAAAAALAHSASGQPMSSIRKILRDTSTRSVNGVPVLDAAAVVERAISTRVMP